MYLALKNAEKKGDFIYFLTLTISHTREDDLKENTRLLKKAAALFRKRKSYLDIVGSSSDRITSLEITHGFSNGWHPHIHEVLFSYEIGKTRLRQIEDNLAKEWKDCCEKIGLRTSIKYGLKLIPAKVKDKDLKLDIAKYVTTSVFFENTIDHSIVKEMALPDKKHGREQNKTVFQYLDEIRELSKSSDSEDIKRKSKLEAVVASFYRGVKGVNFLQYGKGLKARLGVEKYAEDWSGLINELKNINAYEDLYPTREVKNNDKNTVKRDPSEVFHIPEETFKRIFRKQVAHELLCIVENGKIPKKDVHSIISALGKGRYSNISIEDFALYLRRCFVECCYIDIELFMSGLGYFSENSHYYSQQGSLF